MNYFYNKKVAVFTIFVTVFATATAQKYFQGYSGGMMLHTGYVWGGSVHTQRFPEKIKIEGMPFGIGGLLRFHLGKHLCIGGEGYNSTLFYGKNKSNTTLSWGGLLIDYQYEIKKFTVFSGGTVGGGSVKNITVFADVSNPNAENAVYQRYAIMLINPFIGTEYALSPKIHLIMKADYLINITAKRSDFATGFRIYAGFVFFHGRKNAE